MTRLLAFAFALLVPFSALAQITAKKAALATAHPLATRAGLAVLQKGGNAADAAVAVAFVLAVVHPQAGNLGGGGFAVCYDAKSRGVWTLDFRETAPAAVNRTTFAAAPPTGARAAGVPGTVAGLEALHSKFGTRSWKELLAPAIALAGEGSRDDAELKADMETAKRDRKLELPEALPPPQLQATLQRMADHGAHDLYDGALAAKLVEGVKAGGGLLGFRDLRDYEPVWRAAVKLRYGAYEIYTSPPPSTGSIVIGETLNILAGDDLKASGFQTAKSLHLILEAQRRAQLDAARYVGDPLGTRVALRELLSSTRAEQWRKTIDVRRATGVAALAEPRALSPESEHTTHFTIADAAGNVVSLTTSLGDNFGSGFLVPALGFFMNEAMNDFTSGTNAADPGKRPVSSMSPVIVLRDGKPFLALGTKGGAAIPTTIVQVLLNVAVYGKSLRDAVAAPRYHQQLSPEDVLYDRKLAPTALIDALNGMGHGVAARDAVGDVHAILFERNRLIAVADPRRGGAAGGY